MHKNLPIAGILELKADGENICTMRCDSGADTQNTGKGHGTHFIHGSVSRPWFMSNFNLISLSCPRTNIALQCRIMVQSNWAGDKLG